MPKDIDDQPLLFGKHQGKTPKELLEEDPSYLVWLYETMEDQLSTALYEEACEAKEAKETESDTYDMFNRER